MFEEVLFADVDAEGYHLGLDRTRRVVALMLLSSHHLMRCPATEADRSNEMVVAGAHRRVIDRDSLSFAAFLLGCRHSMLHKEACAALRACRRLFPRSAGAEEMRSSAEEMRSVYPIPVIICWYSGQLTRLTLITHSGESRRGATLRDRTRA